MRVVKRFCRCLAGSPKAPLVTLVFVPSALAASATLFGGATMSRDQVSLSSGLSTATTVDDFSGSNFTHTGVTT